MAWNGFHMEGCKALNKALVVNRTLNELNVSCNRIDKKCLDELLKGLIKNEGIEIFRVREVVFCIPLRFWVHKSTRKFKLERGA